MKKKELSELIRQVTENEEEVYRDFFKRALKKFKVKSPAELDKKKRRDFFVWVDTHYQASDEREEYQDYELNESNAEDIYQQSAGKEKLFYDILNDLHDEMNSEDYYDWVSSQLLNLGHDMSVTSDNLPTAEETLFKFLNNEYSK